MRTFIFVAILMTSGLWPTISQAGIFKCIVKGKVIYQEKPCADSKTVADLELIDNSSDSTQAREELATHGLNAGDTNIKVETVSYMNDYDVKNRLKELESSMRATDATPEKINASRTEMGILNSRQVRKLSYQDETLRSSLRRDLGSIQQNVRSRAESNLYNIYNKY